MQLKKKAAARDSGQSIIITSHGCDQQKMHIFIVFLVSMS